MRIGIIGAGMIGSALARRLAPLGHDVAIANSRGPESLQALASELGVRAVTAAEAARSGEIVVVTIPQGAIPRLPRGLFDGVPADVAVVDTGNYYPSRDGRIAELDEGKVESVWVSEHLGRPVVKAFNNIYASHLIEKARPKGAPDRVALPVSGDPPATTSASARNTPSVASVTTTADTLMTCAIMPLARPQARPTPRPSRIESGTP